LDLLSPVLPLAGHSPSIMPYSISYMIYYYALPVLPLDTV
jgi:hypothetical protein